ncbi:7661_t:CDS:2 [Entrophospora sp. SA101]|nr:7661_t:CDS:2 [Entrophospora sp. SA101]
MNPKEISPNLPTNQQEKSFDCIDDEDIKEDRKEAQPHCQECNQIIPFHLLRGYFYRIIESGAFFRLLVTGKGTDNRGEIASGKGIKYKGERRVFFITLQYANKSDSALSGDALHYVFDEAMPSDGRQLENPNEEAPPAERGKYGRMLDTVRNPRRHKTGTYEEIKDCIYARELKQGTTNHQKFWYKKGEEEELEPDILHICFSPEEYIDNKTLPDFFTGETENKAHQAKQTITNLINANITNFDKSENEKEPATNSKEKELTNFIPHAKKETNGDLVIKAEDINKILLYLKRKAEAEETTSQEVKKLKDTDK